MLRNFPRILLFVALTALAAAVPAQQFDEGIEYRRITPVVPVETDAGVEVVELFWYGCPHCFTFEPHLKRWLSQKPEHVTFKRVPAVFGNPVWALHARAFYTAEALGVLDTIHEPLFNAIHLQRRPLSSEQQLAEFFAEHGVAGESFKKTFHSFGVNAAVRRAADLSERYQIGGVPALVVEGKHRTEGPMAASYEGMLQVLDFLIAQEGDAGAR